MRKNVIGYWNYPDKPETKDYPDPIPNSATDDEIAQSVLILRHEIKPRASLLTGTKISMCRCCGSFNHIGEYFYRVKVKGEPMTVLLIPEGLEHYIVKHRVLVPRLLTIKFT